MYGRAAGYWVRGVLCTSNGKTTQKRRAPRPLCQGSSREKKCGSKTRAEDTQESDTNSADSRAAKDVRLTVCKAPWQRDNRDTRNQRGNRAVSRTYAGKARDPK